MINFNATYRQEIIFVRLLLPFTLGIMSSYGTQSTGIRTWLILINILLFAFLCFQHIGLKKINIRMTNGLNGLIFHILFFLTGCLCCTLYKNHINTDYYGFKESNFIKIRISDEPENRQNIILFTAYVTQSAHQKHDLNIQEHNYHLSNAVSGKIKIILLKKTGVSADFKYGDEFIMPAKFMEPPPPMNPSEFDFKSWLSRQNIYHQAFLNEDEIVKLETNGGNKLLRFAIDLRKNQVDTYRRLIKDDDAFAVASTLILGYRADLSTEIMEVYSKTGTIHALSVSGMHVGILYLLLNQLLGFLNKRSSTQLMKVMLILLTIWFYAIITGCSASVLRASVMISVFIIAKLFNKNTNSYNIIAFTALVLLLYNPFLIWDVGFQLSFIAVLGLIYLQPKIRNSLVIKQFWLAKIWEVVTISLAAQIATYPLSIYYFHQFPLYFLMSNLFITLPVALIMYISILISLFKLDSLGPVFEWLIVFTNSGLAQIASFRYSGITAIWLSKTELILLSAALLLFILACVQRQKNLLIVSLFVFLCLQGVTSYHKVTALHQKKILKFSLKKHYAVAAISAQQALLFTDLKVESKEFKYAVKPALDQHRITQISFIAVNVTSDLKDNLIFDQLK